MSPFALSRRADEMGIDARELEAADSAADRQGAFIDLILRSPRQPDVLSMQRGVVLSASGHTPRARPPHGKLPPVGLETSLTPRHTPRPPISPNQGAGGRPGAGLGPPERILVPAALSRNGQQEAEDFLGGSECWQCYREH